MLMDNTKIFYDDEALTLLAITGGSIDMQDDQAVPTGGFDEPSWPMGKGTGSQVMVHIVISPDPADGTTPGGSFAATLKIGDTNPATVVVQVGTWHATDFRGNKGLHGVMAIPTYQVGRYATLDIDAAAATGLGTAPTATAFVFAQ